MDEVRSMEAVGDLCFLGDFVLERCGGHEMISLETLQDLQAGGRQRFEDGSLGVPVAKYRLARVVPRDQKDGAEALVENGGEDPRSESELVKALEDQCERSQRALDTVRQELISGMGAGEDEGLSRHQLVRDLRAAKLVVECTQSRMDILEGMVLLTARRKSRGAAAETSVAEAPQLSGQHPWASPMSTPTSRMSGHLGHLDDETPRLPGRLDHVTREEHEVSIAAVQRAWNVEHRAHAAEIARLSSEHKEALAAVQRAWNDDRKAQAADIARLSLAPPRPIAMRGWTAERELSDKLIRMEVERDLGHADLA
ncbi:hypothetical protein T484DRAFT_1910116, partial [Baffinella frigidus]